MELPITVIITLFVALLVAIGVIFFSKDVLLKSRQNLNELGNENEIKDKVISISGSGGTIFQDLAVQCAKDHLGSLERELCFVVRGSGLSPSVSQSIQVKGRTFTIQNTVASGATAAFIYYDPPGQITIEG